MGNTLPTLFVRNAHRPEDYQHAAQVAARFRVAYADYPSGQENCVVFTWHDGSNLAVYWTGERSISVWCHS